MKYLISYLFALLIIVPGCSKDSDSSRPQELFDEFWTFVDENYIYFELKGVNWDEVYDKYSALITPTTSEDELFDLMEAALLELKDHHNRLESEDRKARVFDFKEGYDIHFSMDLIHQNYIKDSLGQLGSLTYYMLEDTIGYIRFPRFEKYGGLHTILQQMKESQVQKLIIDVRGNGGGDSDAVPKMLGVLAENATSIGAYIEKSGPDHEEVTPPLTIHTSPSQSFQFDIPIIVLMDRGCYSATSYFVAMIGVFENVTLMGQKTGGGGGGNLGYQLSNGWLVAVSVSDFLDANGVSIENGVVPDVEVVNTEVDIESGVDAMLEMAMKH